MKEAFIEWKPNTVSLDLLTKVQSILEEYQREGYILTLRQLYYQLVAGDLLPAFWADKSTGSTNNISSYKRLGHIVNKGRLAGIIDWNMIEDRNRTVVANTHWNSPTQILKAAANSFYLNHWNDQPNYVFVMAEKDAVSNIIGPVCQKYDVEFMANKGYSSQSAMYRLFQTIDEKLNEGKNVVCIYLGDFDPSGIDMDRDILDRLELFLGYTQPVTRIALTMGQIKQYKPPENPAKNTDTRYDAYKKLYGTKSWELDALKPQVLSKLIEDEILKHIDMEIFNEVEKTQNESKIKINEFADKWRDFNDDENKEL